LAQNGDIIVPFWQIDPGPNGMGTYPPAHRHLARLDANGASVVWDVMYGPGVTDAFNSFDNNARVVARWTQGDYITMGAVGDSVSQVQVVNDAAQTTLLSPSINSGAAMGADGSTVWLWGSTSGRLNPWSQMTWTIPTQATQLSLPAAYIIGAQDNGQSIGPWITEGDAGALIGDVVVDPNGDLLVTLLSSGPVQINGGQSLLMSAGYALAKLSGSTGKVVWRTDVTALPSLLSVAPGGRIATVIPTMMNGSVDPTGPYTLYVYDDSDGSLLTSFSAGQGAQRLAAGTTELFVIGASVSPANFSPGAKPDVQGNPSGVFVSRFSF
jgi:hypothetical protein